MGKFTEPFLKSLRNELERRRGGTPADLPFAPKPGEVVRLSDPVMEVPEDIKDMFPGKIIRVKSAPVDPNDDPFIPVPMMEVPERRYLEKKQAELQAALNAQMQETMDKAAKEAWNPIRPLSDELRRPTWKPDAADVMAKAMKAGLIGPRPPLQPLEPEPEKPKTVEEAVLGATGRKIDWK